MTTTRKHPRTIEEAFGPYQRGNIYEEVDPMPMVDKVILAISAFVAVGLLGCILFGVIQ